jgi:putative colanic acid biosynthesis acetyltransferase WcaF
MAKIVYHTYINKLSYKNRLGRLMWNIVYFVMVFPAITKYLNFWRIWIYRLFGAKIGRDCYISSSVRVWAPWNLLMKDHSLLASNVRCYNPEKVLMESETIISEGVFLCTASHDIYSSLHSLVKLPIVIESQAWVAADAFIGMGVTVGQGAVVGARAAVFKDVEPWTVVGGNPAKFIKKRIIKS